MRLPDPAPARGYGLLEVLVVVAVLAMMMALLLPAVSAFSSTAGRRGAVHVLMNTFEQARAAALESGQLVYVGFADRDFPDASMRYAAFIVFRDASDEEMSLDSTRRYVVLKKWTRLPRNVSLKSDIAGSLVSQASTRTFDSRLANELGSTTVDLAFPAVAFNGAGAVEEPPGNNLFLFLYDGYYADGADKLTRPEGQLFEKISLSRYTGRVQLDITATGS